MYISPAQFCQIGGPAEVVYCGLDRQRAPSKGRCGSKRLACGPGGDISWSVERGRVLYGQPLILRVPDEVDRMQVIARDADLSPSRRDGGPDSPLLAQRLEADYIECAHPDKWDA